MIRISHFLIVPFVAISSLLFSPLYADSTAAETIIQAEKDLKSSAQSGAVWHIIDKATGTGAVGIDKLLKLAKKRLNGGREKEAKRLATRVSWAAKLGMRQANEQKNAKPYY